MKPIIRVENISKKYRLGASRKPYATLRESLMSAVRFPVKAFKKNGSMSGDEVLWALRDVSFEVMPSEVVGIIGRNGAGKSTLLKILSRITEPTTGKIELYGRVASLLEVGTGFHPELTGRENIFLNGAILGMRREEIATKFDEIVDFAEIEKFLDTPVKYYSSGMYVRLAFAVAAHLEPEVLVVDEVLAVGDAEFQKKCLGKMGEVASHGRTVLFVSHNMSAVNILCSRVILLEAGGVKENGKTSSVISTYLDASKGNGGEHIWRELESAPGNDKIRLAAVRVISENQVRQEVEIDKEVKIEIDFWNLLEGNRLFTTVTLSDSEGKIILESATTPGANKLPEEWFHRPYPVGLFRSICTLPANFLNEECYYISISVVGTNPPAIEAEAPQILAFNVFDTGAMRTPGFGGRWQGVVRVPLAWQTQFVESSNGAAIK